jgi:hypothetical protein
MLAKLVRLRVNFVIVFVGASLIILLIKLTSILLPPKYYFNFSKLVAGGSEPFIVDPPGVTGSKLCEVMTRYAIPENLFNRPIPCGEDYELNRISREEIDNIYTTALKSDQAIRNAFREVARQVPLHQLSDAEVKRIASKSETVGRAFDDIYNYYANQLGALANTGPSSTIEALYNGSDRANAPVYDYQPDDRPDAPAHQGLSEDITTRLVQAHQSLRPQLTSAVLVQRIRPIRKSSIDEIVRRAQAGGGVGWRVASYYSKELVTGLRDSMSSEFSRYGVASGFETDRQLIFAEINNFSSRNYMLSILLRLTPVFLFGFLVAIAVGRAELFSIALAGGLAAFLLSWPLILMWDRLVQSNWADQKGLFFAFYAVYIVSFFLTARSAAVLATWLQQTTPNLATQSMQAMEAQTPVTWREVAVNVVAAIILNGIVYVWNVWIPLSFVTPLIAATSPP